MRKTLVLLLLVSFPGLANAAQQPLVQGTIDLSFYAVTGAVIQEVLEQSGCAVEVKKASHKELYPLLAEGKIDLLVAAWLPEAHAVYWRNVKDEAIELATLYEGARLFWGVPEYVPESSVRSVEDLTKPGVAEQMTKTIQGSGPSSGLMMRSQKMMTAYGLDETGYRLLFGTGRDRAQAFIEAVAEKEWVIIPLGMPQYLNKAYNIRPLREPKGLLGGANRAVLLAHKSLPGKISPGTLNTLRRIHLGIDAVNEMDYLVNVERKTPEEAARNWMNENQQLVRSWFGEQ